VIGVAVLYIEGGSVTEVFTRAVAAVLREGRPTSPRGMPTVEVMPAHVCLGDPRARLLNAACGRRVNPAFAAAEAVWVLDGSDEPWIYRFNGRLRDYADAGVLRGAYGPRLRAWPGPDGVVDQLAQVRRLLMRDPDTRRATVCLFDPARDFAGARDVPCTVTWRFFIRYGRLEMHSSMRSQDLWLGLPYDLFTATVVQELLAGWCGVEVGDYHHEVSSLHLYRRDLAAAAAVRPVTGPARRMEALPVAWELLPDLLDRLLTDEPVVQAGWDAVSAVLRSYTLWRAGCLGDARGLASTTPGLLGEALAGWYAHLAGRSRAAS